MATRESKKERITAEKKEGRIDKEEKRELKGLAFFCFVLKGKRFG